MKLVQGKKIIEADLASVLAEKQRFTKIIIDLGCGDGRWTYREARSNPANLYIGIEPDAGQLVETSAKALKKPAKGGLDNLIFINSAVEELDQDFNEINSGQWAISLLSKNKSDRNLEVDEMHINFPWGSLLEGVVKADTDILKGISQILRPEGRVFIWFSYDSKFEDKYIGERDLPEINNEYLRDDLSKRYADFGLETTEIKKFTDLSSDEIPKTSWSKQILSERNRVVWFLEVRKIDTNFVGATPSFDSAQDDMSHLQKMRIGKEYSVKPNSTEDRLTYTFHCFGHPEITAKHVKTLEFTKDSEITERADCIIGVRSDFDLNELKKFSKKVKFICTVTDPETDKNLVSEFKCTVNPNFDSEKELVLRKSMFDSHRTFGFNLNRGASRLDRKIVEIMQDPEAVMEVEVLDGWY